MSGVAPINVVALPVFCPSERRLTLAFPTVWVKAFEGFSEGVQASVNTLAMLSRQIFFIIPNCLKDKSNNFFVKKRNILYLCGYKYSNMSDINYKNISNTSAKILSVFMKQGKTWFTIAQAYASLADMTENQIRVQIKRMTDEGLLMRVRAGVYYIIPYEQDSTMFMPDWHLLAAPLTEQDHYIGYYAALQIHQLITQPSLREQIVVNRQIKSSEVNIKGVKFQFIYHNEKHFFGYKKVWIDSFNCVFCSDLEKTLIDCLYKPNYAGGVIEIAKAIFMSKGKINFDKLLDYVIRFGTQAVIKRLGYLLELLRIETPIIEILRQKRSASVSLLDPEAPKGGKILSRWNIQQNIDIETIKSSFTT
jgi:predicted transcriptional regulator of viral defense system